MDADKIINTNISEYQKLSSDWDHSSLAKQLQEWTVLFSVQFKLETDTPLIKFENLRKVCFDRFCMGRNGLGLKNEITLNLKYFKSDTVDFEILGTLLHELLHAEQQFLKIDGSASNKRNYHNTKFINRAAELGLLVDAKGRQRYAPPPTPFTELLKKHGIIMPETYKSKDVKAHKIIEEIPAESKLKLWVCGCKPKPIKVRVAIEKFQALCLKCKQIFTKKVNI